MPRETDNPRAAPLRVLFVSTSYPQDLRDWRGLFIRHMAFALARSGFASLLMWTPPGEMPDGAVSLLNPSDKAWFSRLMAAGGIAHLVRRGGLLGWKEPISLLLRQWKIYRRTPDIDLYHVNWLQSALTLPDNGKPVLITVLGTDMKLLRLPLVKPLLRRVMRRRRVMICPNADWMEQPLRDTFGDVAEIRAVFFGVDPCWFELERNGSAAASKKWLAVTRLTRDKLGPLLEWGESQFSGPERELHLFGPMQESLTLPPWVHYHGPATPEQLSTEWFPAACGLVSLSQHAEGRPQVMLEAMAAGIPIVASSIDAHAAVVDDGVTGRLCEGQAQFNDALREVEVLSVNENMSAMARRTARRIYGTWDDCADRYIDAYRQLLGTAP